MSCGIGCRCGSDPVLLWLWCSPVAVAPIRPLAWEPSHATSVALKRKKKKKIQCKAARTGGANLLPRSPVPFRWGRVAIINVPKAFHSLVSVYWTKKGEEEERNVIIAYPKEISHFCLFCTEKKTEGHRFFLQRKSLKLGGRIIRSESQHLLTSCVFLATQTL